MTLFSFFFKLYSREKIISSILVVVEDFNYLFSGSLASSTSSMYKKICSTVSGDGAVLHYM